MNHQQQAGQQTLTVGTVELSNQEMCSVMSGYSPTNRKILFLVLAYKKARRAFPSQALIAGQVGLSRTAVNIRIMQMERDGIIKKLSHGVRWSEKGNPCGQPNEYIVRISKKKEPSPWLSERESVVVRTSALDKDFTIAYWTAVHDMFGHLRLASLMTKKEYAEYLDIKRRAVR